MRTVFKLGDRVLALFGNFLANEVGDLLVDENGDYITFI